MEKLTELLNEPLDTNNPVTLMEQLSQAEAWQVRVSQSYRDRKSELADARNASYPMKDKDMFSSAEARLIYMEAATSAIQAETDKLRDLAEIIKERISLGQSMLANHRTEVKSGVRMV
jgi:hypothetical protein